MSLGTSSQINKDVRRVTVNVTVIMLPFNALVCQAASFNDNIDWQLP